MDEAHNSRIYKEHELDVIQKQFAHYLFNSFKMELHQKMKEWYKLEWVDFKKEILKTGEALPYRKQHDLHEYFTDQKNKVLSLRQELSNLKYDQLKSGISR